MSLRDVLRRPRYRLLMSGVFILFMAIYTLFDFREGGRDSNLLTTRMAEPAFYIDYFGAWWFYGAIILNVLMAGATAALMTFAIANYRARKSGIGGATCSAAGTTVLGFAVFGCPGCLMPFAGTLGITLFANSMPLMGLELKALSLAILVGTLYWMNRQASAPDHVSGARSEISFGRR